MTATPPALPPATDCDQPTHHELLLSIVYPGAGQWVQGRKGVAMVIMLTITVLFLWICWLIVRPVVNNFAALMEFGGKTAADTMTGSDIVASLVHPQAITAYILFGLVYLLSMGDAWLAYHQRKTPK